MELFIAVLLTLSVSLNIWQFAESKKIKKPNRTLTQDASSLMRDIFASGAVVKVQVLDPRAMMLISPKTMGDDNG